MVLDFAAYNKDNLSNAAGRLISLPDPTTGVNGNVRLLTNADFGNTRGIDVRLDRRFGNLFNGTLSLHLPGCQEHRLRSGYLHRLRIPGDECGLRRQQPPPQAILPTDFNRPHTLAAAASLTFPERLEPGDGGRDDPARTWASTPPSATPAARPYTALLAGLPPTRTWCRATTATGSSPRRSTAPGSPPSRN